VIASAHGFLRRLKGFFITGLIAILPLLLTVFVLKWVAGIVNGHIGPRTMLGGMLQSIGYKFSSISNLWLSYGIGIALVIVVIFVLGALLESGSKRTMERIAQKTVHRLPLVRAIYKATDKFINLVPSGDSDQLKGMQVVFCQFGQGKDSTGTLALMPTPELFKIGERDYCIVVIPTAPIPIGGAMLFMPAESVFPTTMSIDAFIGSYVSLGVVTARFDIGTALKDRRN
jgi:uncharacterized membrane protein